jgi:hypothetical protein
VKLKDWLLKSFWQDPNYDIHQMACPEITLEEVPQDLYDKLLSEATAAGAKFDGEKVDFDHCEFNWSYDAPSQTLHITCTKKPFFIDCPTIEQKIRELVKGAKDVVG